MSKLNDVLNEVFVDKRQLPGKNEEILDSVSEWAEQSIEFLNNAVGGIYTGDKDPWYAEVQHELTKVRDFIVDFARRVD
jgi:hypothetical protein